jgi:membrane carboxypeptidase/penicillin-binding protein
MPRWLRWTLITSGAVTLFGVLAAGGAGVWVVTLLPRPLPNRDVLESFAPREGSLVFDANDDLITELHGERQIFVPLDSVSPWVVDALLACASPKPHPAAK